MFPIMKQTMYNENIFAQRNLRLIVGGVLDEQDLGDIQYQLFLASKSDYSFL